MVLSFERENSLYDLRRTQRRVAALLLTDTHVDLQRYPLRRRILPQGYCYVCSRVDPSGVFKNPNSHLFKKGFFNGCEHFPQAPFTTFVREDGPVVPRDDTLTDLATNQTAAPSISVTIRKGSRSTKFQSPLKREGSSVSAPDKQSQSLNDDKVSLPSIATNQDTKRKSGTETKSSTKGGTLRTPSEAKTRLSRLSKRSLPQPVPSEHEPVPTPNDKITIPTARDDDGAVSGLSTFTGRTTPTKSATDIDTISSSKKEFDPLFKNKMNGFMNTQTDTGSRYSAKSLDRPIGPYINQSDGLQDQFAVEPLVREVVMLSVSDDMHTKRPHAGRMRERRLPSIPTDRTSARSTSTYRPGSGHLRYHHRLDEDSVPYQGFDMPPTPSDELPLSLDQLTLPNDSIFDSGSSKGVPDSSISDDASLNMSEKTSDVRQSRYSGKFSEKFSDRVTDGVSERVSERVSDRRSFCRCATDVREMSFVRNICRNCGKSCMCGSGTAGSRVSSKTRQPTGNDSAVSSSKRSLSQRMDLLQPDDGRTNLRSKPLTDEDYMDLNSIIHEDDGHYFSGDDEDQESSMSPLSWFRHPHPLPTVDPDIHKLAYLQALKAARMRNIWLSDEMDLEDTPTLRRATVFSYIPLLPYRGKNAHQPAYLGLRPDDSDTPKKGQYMKHIFGNVNPDDFYPGGKAVTKQKVIIDDSTQDSSTIQLSTGRTDPQSTKEPQNELERSSVSLKMMRKPGIIVNDDT